MSVFASPIRNNSWVWQIALLSVLFGGLAAASLRTQDRIRGEGLPGTRPQQVFGAYNEMRATVSEQKKKIGDLQQTLTKYQEATAKETDKTKLLYSDLQKANVMAGVVAVTGPGIVVTLRDSKKAPRKPADVTEEDYLQLVNGYHIHDQDIQTAVNELRAAGAEAISINDQRVVALTAIRCVGPVVQVNSVATNASPVVIKAIGDADAMYSGLTMTGGMKDQYAMTDPSMCTVEKAKGLTLPAYAGATPLRWAQVATEKKAQDAQRASEKASENAPDPITTKTSGDQGTAVTNELPAEKH